MLAPLIISETRRRLLEESIPRLRICLGMLNDNQIWWRPNDQSNSIGNLVLHLNGNVRQWIFSGLLKEVDTRQRSLEFEARESHRGADLDVILAVLAKDLDLGLGRISPEMLEAVHPVQIYEETGTSILVHVIEHFSYHTGQVAWITKMLTGQDTGFYTGQDL